METINWLELFGYLASITTAISLMMSSVLKLRWINMIGSTLFTVYGLLIGAMPVAALNCFIVGVNIWFLWKMHHEKQHFSLLETNTQDVLLNEFIRSNRAEIEKFFPQFGISESDNFALIIHRDFSIAGIFIGSQNDRGELHIKLDYVLPRFRDLMPGKFLFHDNRTIFQNKGITELLSQAKHPSHADYLRKIGFQKKEEIYLLPLTTPNPGK